MTPDAIISPPAAPLPPATRADGTPSDANLYARAMDAGMSDDAATQLVHMRRGQQSPANLYAHISTALPEDAATQLTQYATGAKPDLLDRLKTAGRVLLPQDGESVAHTVGRDVTGVVAGTVKPAFDAFFTPQIGETVRPNPRTSGVPTGYGAHIADAEHGAITSEQQRQAAIATTAGAVASVLPIAKLGSPLLRGIARMVTGAGVGATYNPDDPAVGAVVGGVAGAVPDIATGTARGALAAGTKVLGYVPGAQADALRALLGTGTAAESKVARAMTTTDANGVRSVRPEVQATLDAQTKAGLGDQVTAADANPLLQRIALDASKKSVPAYDALAASKATQNAGSLERTTNAVTDQMGNPNAQQIIDQMNASTGAWGDAAYDNLRDSNPSVNAGGDLASLMKKPEMQAAWNHAKLAENLGDTPGQYVSEMLGQKVDPSKSLGLTMMSSPTPPVSYASLQQLQTILKGKSFAARSNPPLARAWSTLANGVGDHLEQFVPEHKAVVAEYARQSSLPRAVQAGADAWKNTVNSTTVANDLQKLAARVPAGPLHDAQVAEAIDAYRKGLTSSWLTELNAAGSNTDAAAKYLTASPGRKAKIAAAFGTSDAFGNFMDKLRAEDQLSQLSLGARPTAGTGFFDVNDLAVSPFAAVMAMHNPVYGAAVLGRPVARAIARRTAGGVGEMLATQGAPQISAMADRLAALKTARQIVPAMNSPIATTALSAGLSNAISSLWRDPLGSNGRPGDQR
jgi:hypothetical protein